MNADQVGQTPILGREGLLRLVEVVERLRARARAEGAGSWTSGEAGPEPGPELGLVDGVRSAGPVCRR
jgi:hypothetical protein